jgi:integrase/recombinase XerC
MALLMLDAGLRVGEVVILKIDELIMGNQPVAAINLDKYSCEKKCERIVPCTLRLVEAIEAMYSIVWSLKAIPPTSFAFFDSDILMHLSVRQVQRIIGTASLAAFNRYVHPHVLRHTFATRLMRVTSTAVVQQLLGHKHLSSTQVYVHPNGDDCKAAIDKLTSSP